MCAGSGIQIKMPSLTCRTRLPLPVADAARPARPDLNSGVASLGLHGISPVKRNQRSWLPRCRSLRARVSDPLASGDLVRGFDVSRRFALGTDRVHRHSLRIDHQLGCIRYGLVATVDCHIQWTGRKACGRAEGPRRQHGLREVETEEIAGAIWLRGRKATPYQGHANGRQQQTAYFDHQGLPKRVTPHIRQSMMHGGQFQRI